MFDFCYVIFGHEEKGHQVEMSKLSISQHSQQNSSIMQRIDRGNKAIFKHFIFSSE